MPDSGKGRGNSRNGVRDILRSRRAFRKIFGQRALSRIPALLFLAVLTPCGVAAKSQKPEENQPSYKVQSNVVLVHADVRDGKGRPVRGLKASDFELLEDGVRQTILSVEAFGDAAEKNSASTVDSALIERARKAGYNRVLGEDFVALIFHRLSPQARPTITKAAKEYVLNVATPGTRFGVFFVDMTMKILQFYTTDREAVLAAIDRVGSTVSSRSSAADSIPLSSSDRGEVGAAAVAAYGPPDIDALAGRVWQQMEKFYAELSRIYEGHAATTALLAIMNSMLMLPGRRSIVLFSEGVELPDEVFDRFSREIEAARDAGISINTVDAAGLRVRSTAAAVTSGVSVRVAGGITRLDAQWGLNVLAKRTGGVFVRDTNDFVSGLEKIDRDIHSYYLLAYAPKNTKFDGRYRRIEVRVKDPKVSVISRRGYFAADAPPDPDRIPLEYEGPALAALTADQPEHEIPLRTGVFDFPSLQMPGHLILLAEVDSGILEYRAGPKWPTSNFIVLFRIVDEEGKAIRQVSQQYRLSHEQDETPEDSILFYKEVAVPAGRYTVETAAFDAVGSKAGTGRTTLIVPEPDPALPSLSSLVLVQRTEPIKKNERGADTPLEYSGTLLYPLLGDRWHPSGSFNLPFYFSVYGNESQAKEAIIDLSHYAQSLGRTRVELPAPDADGRIQYLGTLPMADRPAGLYTLQVAIPAGAKVVTRSCRFFLVP